ncbi:MAG: hypothetical protein AB8E15_00420 [Bdellovibrionales bacterium]
MLKGILLCLFTLVSLNIAAETQNLSFEDRVENAVESYYRIQEFKSNISVSINHPDPTCRRRPSLKNCSREVCRRLGAFSCDDSNEIAKVNRMCRGVHGECVASSCDRLGRFNCDDFSEVEKVANSCRGIFDYDCVSFSCNKLGNFGCDDLSEIQAVGALCKGNVEADCMRFSCEQLGRFGCDDIGELRQVADSCAGREK